MKEKECGSSKAWGIKVLPFYFFTFIFTFPSIQDKDLSTRS